MSIKRWLNRYSLFISVVTFSSLAALGFASAEWMLRKIGFPYFRVERQFMDYVAYLGRSAPKDPRLVFLADDSPSHTLDQLWPEDLEASPTLRLMKKRVWSRQIWADVLERLTAAGARVIAFDYMFKGEDDGDAALRAGIDRHADKVVLGSHIDDAAVAMQKMPAISPPDATLIGEAADPRVGFINMFPDPDGVVRRMRFRLTREELAGKSAPDAVEYESFAARMARQAGEGAKIPAGRGWQPIRYAYKGETMRAETKPASLYSIFVPAFWEANYGSGEFFRGKLVIVGPEGNYTKDVGESPFGTIAGPEFHLNALNALLTGEYLHRLPLWVDLSLIAGGGLLAWLVCRFVGNALLRLALLPVIGFAAYAGAVAAYNAGNIVPLFSPLLALVGSVITATAWQQIIERLEKAKLRRTFERYVSRDVVKELLDNPASYLNTVGGARKKVTVLFSDVRGFTTITESGDAHALVLQLNEYFDQMVNIVFANKGTLDKFIGDAVMAQWGGIYSDGEKADAILAVRTAIQMRKALARLNPGWVARGMLELKFGIGVNHGEAIVGNLGCEAKMEVSLIGDAVNTASRLEGMTKEFHLDLLIGESVERFIRETFIVRTVTLSLPKGKTKPLEIFTVLDERGPGVSEPEWLKVYEEGVRLYRARAFAEAAAQFEKVAEALPEDWLAAQYFGWCEDYLAKPPPKDWNGVYTMRTK